MSPLDAKISQSIKTNSTDVGDFGEVGDLGEVKRIKFKVD